MQARTRFEHEAEAQLKNEGFSCIRSAGSRGPFDLIAFSPCEVRLIQVKSTKALGRHGNVTVFTNAIGALLEPPAPTEHVSRWLLVKVLRGKWYAARVDEYSRARAELQAQVRKIIARWEDGQDTVL